MDLATPTAQNHDFGEDVLKLDAAGEVERIVVALRKQVLADLGRRGAVLGLSGGVDSSVVAALCVRAFGKSRVLGIFMPERESSGDSLRLGRQWASRLGIATALEDITQALEGLGSYRRQVEAIQTVIPEYDQGWKCKLVMSPVGENHGLNVTRLMAQGPDRTRLVRLSSEAYLQIVAATNYKQRIRKTSEYYHADRLRYAVVGTANLLEYDQGFFVKQGDGIADVMPIAHLYKTQVYQLAEYLDVDDEIRRRPPTSDTYSMPQSQEEFYFNVPYWVLDLCLYAVNHGVAAQRVADTVGLSADKVEMVFRDIHAKRRAARYLHAPPLQLSIAVEE